MPLDLAPLARKLVDSSDETQRAATDGEMGAREEGRQAVTIPPPRREPLPDLPDYTLAIVDDEELHALIRAQFEGAGDGAELPRLFAYLASRPQLQLPEALRHRAAEIIESVWDERNASPRRLLAAALLGRDDVSFRAMPAMSWPARASRIPWAWHCRKTRSPAKATTWRPATGRSAIPGPPARATNICRRMRRWLCWPASFTNCGPAGCGASLSFRRWRFPSSASCGNGWWPSRAQGLSRDLQVLGEGPKPFWMAAADASTSPALDVADVPAEFTFRAQEAREQDGYDQVVQWTAWLLRSNPDTLAAHFHPMLCAAVNVINVRGLGPLLAALGASRRAPGGPVYSALALAASAKMTEQRAQAAEAIARLADVGLLDPAPFAEQIAAHLADGFALAGRLAQTLADASSISALAGCRALQTLEALLPRLVDADGKPMAPAAKLIELAARLSNDYGMPIALPATLAARRRARRCWR